MGNEKHFYWIIDWKQNREYVQVYIFLGTNYDHSRAI